MENLFVIFAPGCGGNHLANIISTSNRFTKRYTDDIYHSKLDLRAHPSKNKNYELAEEEFIIKQKQNNVFCSHLAEYLISQSLTEKYLLNRKYVIVESPMPSRNDFFTNRVRGLYPAYQNQYFFEEISMLYSIQYFSHLTREHDMTSITVDKIFSKDVTPLVDTLNLELGLDLDIGEVKSIHSSWIEKNKKFL